MCSFFSKDYMTALTCEFNMAFHILATGPQENEVIKDSNKKNADNHFRDVFALQRMINMSSGQTLPSRTMIPMCRVVGPNLMAFFLIASNTFINTLCSLLGVRQDNLSVALAILELTL